MNLTDEHTQLSGLFLHVTRSSCNDIHDEISARELGIYVHSCAVGIIGYYVDFYHQPGIISALCWYHTAGFCRCSGSYSIIASPDWTKPCQLPHVKSDLSKQPHCIEGLIKSLRVLHWFSFALLLYNNVGHFLSKTRDIIFFIPHILSCCQNPPILPQCNLT